MKESSGLEEGGRPGAGDDPRLELIYREALRGLVQQQSVVESMNSRPAT